MRDKLFTICVLLIIFVIPIAVFSKEDTDISVAENRSLFQKKDLTLSNLNEDLENLLQDQFIWGEELKKFYNTEKNKIVEFEIALIEKMNSSMELLPMGNDLYRLANTDYLLYGPKSAESIQDIYENVIDNFNQKSEENPNIKFYLYNIVNDYTLKNKEEFDQFISENLNDNIEFLSSTTINSYDDYKNSFYKTDHHWNKDGQYNGYLDILNLLKINSPLQIQDTKTFEGVKFYGSKDRKLGYYDLYDDFTVNVFQYPKMTVEINGEKVDDYGDANDFYAGIIPSENVEENYYGDFYGWDDGIVKIHVEENSDKEDILIFANSYSNPLNKLIASHFRNTYIVDLRNYEKQLGETFKLKDFLSKNHIDKVLMITNYNYFKENVVID